MEESYMMWGKRRLDYRKIVKRRLEIANGILGGIALVATAFVFCALCVLGSGYNWE